MRNRYSIVVVAALVVVGIAWSGVARGFGSASLDNTPDAGRIRSYYVHNGGVLIPKVEGPHGFIITDIIVTGKFGSQGVVLYERPAKQPGPAEPEATKLIIQASPDVGLPNSFSFRSGIPLAAGSTLRAVVSNGSVTISGYTY